MLKNCSVIVMAAGKGTRFKSKKSKLLHKVAGKTIIKRLSENILSLKPKEIIFVVSYQKEKIIEQLGKNSKFIFTEQKTLNGTAGAIKEGLKKTSKTTKKVLIMPGDTPSFSKLDILKLSKEKNKASVLGLKLDNPKNYGRVILNKENNVLKIVEETDLLKNEKNISSVNTSIYCFDKDFIIKNINKIKKNKNKNEYYFTDIIEIANKNKIKVSYFETNNKNTIGPNDRLSLSFLAKEIYKENAKKHALNGVSFLDIENVFIDDEVKISKDVEIEDSVSLKGCTKIEEDVIILKGSYVKDSTIKKGSVIGPYVYLDQGMIGESNILGPFTYVRPETETKNNVKLGSFVEIKKSKIDKFSKIPHLSYIGDAKVGKRVNIGCGVITCNYDGANKHKTVIEDDAFVGSDSQLVAPVKIEKRSYVGSGTTVTKDVEKESLAISRVKQKNIKDYYKKIKEKKKRKS
jgi:bifunctional UDP-N-acetylglucosamine pyrophosphorylase / glucosamine-1-phosphate N-acetyltransferase